MRTRQCAATGAVLDEDRLVRFALDGEGRVTPDVAAKLPGRGVWVQADRASLELAVKRNAFARSAKRAAVAPKDLADQVEAALARRALDGLGLAKRAGKLALGFDQVEAAIRRAKPAFLIEASDGAEDGRERLQRLSLGLWDQRPALVGCFTAAEMGMALGRDYVVHVALLDERMAQRWAAEIDRLAGFRARTPLSWRQEPSGSDPSGAAP